MYHLGKSPASEMDQKFPMMELRPQTWRIAQEDPDQGPEEGAGDRHVDVIEMTRPYTGFFAMRDYRLRDRHFGGARSAEVSRAAFVSGDASWFCPMIPKPSKFWCWNNFGWHLSRGG